MERLTKLVLFILVAGEIGFLTALAIMLATSLLGFVLLKVAGRGKVARFRAATGPTDRSPKPRSAGRDFSSCSPASCWFYRVF